MPIVPIFSSYVKGERYFFGVGLRGLFRNGLIIL